MGDDHPAVGQGGIDLLQAPGDELVRDAVKAIAQNALAVQRLWYRQPLDELVVAAVKPGIEHGDLEHIGQLLMDKLDRCQFARQMKRHERHDRTQVAQTILIDQRGRRITRASEDETMPDDDGQLAIQVLAQPFGELWHGSGDVGTSCTV